LLRRPLSLDAADSMVAAVWHHFIGYSSANDQDPLNVGHVPSFCR